MDLGASGQGKLKTWLMALVCLALLESPAALAVDYGFAPVSGHVTSPFGWRVDPMNGSRRFHGGIDIAASSGVPVYAPQAGVVAYSGSYGGYGNVVVIDHGNSLYTLYGHNSSLMVRQGMPVARGQIISRVGSTGRSTGPHLHFEVHYNGQYVNPVSYLSLLQQQNPSLAQATPHIHQSRQITPVSYRKPARVARHRSRGGGNRTVQLISGTDVENVRF